MSEVKTRQINFRLEEDHLATMRKNLWEFGEFLAKRGKVGSLNVAVFVRYSAMLTLGLLSREDTVAWLARLARKCDVVDDLVAELCGV